MRRISLLCIATLCLAGTVAAQNDSTAAPAPVSGALAMPQSSHGYAATDDYPWQVGANFDFQKFNIGTNNSNLYGIQSNVTRFLGDGMFGIEGAVSAAFGHINPEDRQQQVFYGGGLHIAKRAGKFQPWGHVLAGGSHVRFNNTGGPAAFNGLGLMAGGGVDILFRPHLSWRLEADFVPTRLSGVWQKTLNTGAGIVINF